MSDIRHKRDDMSNAIERLREAAQDVVTAWQRGDGERAAIAQLIEALGMTTEFVRDPRRAFNADDADCCTCAGTCDRRTDGICRCLPPATGTRASISRDSEVGPRGENLLPRNVDPATTGPGVSRNDDALYSRGGCTNCGRDRVYYDGLCVACFEYMGGDGPGRDSMG